MSTLLKLETSISLEAWRNESISLREEVAVPLEDEFSFSLKEGICIP